MSAIIVLILRITLVLCLYGFLIFSFVLLWKEMRKTNENQTLSKASTIAVEIEGEGLREFAQQEIRIGRSSENDIQFPEETISMNHARIFFHNNHWMLEDTHSTNGTYLNGEKILAATVVVDQDKITIGERNLRTKL